MGGGRSLVHASERSARPDEHRTPENRGNEWEKVIGERLPRNERNKLDVKRFSAGIYDRRERVAISRLFLSPPRLNRQCFVSTLRSLFRSSFAHTSPFPPRNFYEQREYLLYLHIREMNLERPRALFLLVSWRAIFPLPCFPSPRFPTFLPLLLFPSPSTWNREIERETTNEVNLLGEERR